MHNIGAKLGIKINILLKIENINDLKLTKTVVITWLKRLVQKCIKEITLQTFRNYHNIEKTLFNENVTYVKEKGY